MPRIPIVSAQQGPGVLNLPQIQRQTGFEEVSQFGQQLASIDAKIRAQQDDIDLYRNLTETEAELKKSRLDLSADTDYETQPERFAKYSREVMYKKLDSIKSPAVAATYQAHAERLIAEANVHVQTDSMKKIVERQHVERVQLGEQTAQRWADAETPEKRTLIEQNFSGLVQRGSSDPKEQAKLQTGMLEHAMEYLRLTDRQRLRDLHSQGKFSTVDPLKQAKVLREARQDDEHDQNIQQENFNRAKQVYLQGLWSQANLGLLPQSRIEEMKKGFDPFVDPKSVNDLEERNLNPIAGEGAQQVKVVMYEYYKGQATPARIQETRQKLLALEREGVSTGPISKALHEIMSVESARSNAALQAGFDAIKREFAAEETPFMPGRIGQMQKHKRDIEQAEADKEFALGKPIEQILQERRKRRQLEDEQRKQRRSQHEDDASTILKGLGSR